LTDIIHLVLCSGEAKTFVVHLSEPIVWCSSCRLIKVFLEVRVSRSVVDYSFDEETFVPLGLGLHCPSSVCLPNPNVRELLSRGSCDNLGLLDNDWLGLREVWKSRCLRRMYLLFFYFSRRNLRRFLLLFFNFWRNNFGRFRFFLFHFGDMDLFFFLNFCCGLRCRQGFLFILNFCCGLRCRQAFLFFLSFRSNWSRNCYIRCFESDSSGALLFVIK